MYDKLDNLNIYHISDYEFQKFIQEQRKRLNEQLENVKPFLLRKDFEIGD